MIGNLPYKTKQFFFVLIKLSIVTGAFYFIYKKLTNNDQLDFTVFVDFLSKNDLFALKNIIFVLFLSIFNWFFEILKWRSLVSYVKKISIKESVEQNLGALTASIFTPNRIGEYGAKSIYYPRQLTKQIILLNLLGNMSQMFMTTIFGIFGFLLFVNKYNVQISYFKLSRLLIVVFIIVAIAILGWQQNKYHIKGFSIGRIKNYVKSMPSKIHASNLFYSLTRYVIFSFQFFFLLHIFGINLTYLNAMIVISSMYLLVSIIPSIFIFDVIIKGSVAVYLFSFVGANELTILVIVTIMWLLNFVLPSIFGSYHVLNFRWFNSDKE